MWQRGVTTRKTKQHGVNKTQRKSTRSMSAHRPRSGCAVPGSKHVKRHATRNKQQAAAGQATTRGKHATKG
eukprot:6098638-Alexandrium_andersonii.AAC.1